MSRSPIVVEQDFMASADAAWKALTVHSEMIQWYFNNIPDFKPELGFTCKFMVRSEERTFTHLWEVDKVEEGKAIGYSWQYDEYEGKSHSLFEVFEQGEGCKVRITCTGLDTMPDDLPEFTRESCEGGWKYFIQGNLKDYLDGEVRA